VYTRVFSTASIPNINSFSTSSSASARLTILFNHSWWHGSDKNMNWGAFPYGYVYCNMEREGAAYLLLPKDWAVHESTGNKSKLGTFSYETKILTTITNEEKDWSGAKLL
jgi:hypothetical protein